MPQARSAREYVLGTKFVGTSSSRTVTPVFVRACTTHGSSGSGWEGVTNPWLDGISPITASLTTTSSVCGVVFPAPSRGSELDADKIVPCVVGRTGDGFPPRQKLLQPAASMIVSTMLDPIRSNLISW